MRRSLLLVLLGLVLGFGLGTFVWHNHIGKGLRDENVRLRQQASESAALRAENAKLTSERIDPDELQRLRDGQTELLRLRGQVAQLRRRTNTIPVAANLANGPETNSVDSAASPIETFTAKATLKVGWNWTMVAGGWKLPSGNRGVLLLQPMVEDTSPGAVQVTTQILELPESLMSGLNNLETQGKEARGYDALTREEARTLMDKIRNTEGAFILSSPRVITRSGQQAQVAVVETFTGPNGETYSVGPVVDITPTISPDNQSVELAVEARLNLRKTPK